MGGGGEPLRPADDQRDVQPLLVAELLAADVGLAVVAEEDDDRLVGQPVGFEPVEDQPDLAVELGRRVEVRGPVGAGDGVVGLVGRDLDLRGSARFGAWNARCVSWKLTCAKNGWWAFRSAQRSESNGFSGGVKFQSVLPVPLNPIAGGKLADVGREVAGVAEPFGQQRTPSGSR